MLRSFVRMLVCAGLVTFVAACSGDDSGAQEPVKPDEKAAGVPDVPGGVSGEAKEKPAGTGAAGSGSEAAAAASEAAAAEIPPATEMSQPNADAAKKAAASSKDTAKPMAAAEPHAPITVKPGEASVKAQLLNVRSGGGMKSPVTRTLKKGEKVTVKDCKGSWCQIGDKEYVGGRFLQQ